MTKIPLDQFLTVLARRFEIFEADRKAGGTSVQYIAFEALAALTDAHVSGLDPEAIRATWPPEWGQEEVVLPLTVVRQIAHHWLAYRGAPTGTTLGEAFDLEGGGQGKAPARSLQATRDNRHTIARDVIGEFLEHREAKRPISLEACKNRVAEARGVSLETVKAAYKAHGHQIWKRLEAAGISRKG